MMNDVADPPEPAQSLKRSLDIEQGDDTHTPQLIQPKELVATEANEVRADAVNGINGVHCEASDSGEPAAKKLKLNNGEQEAQSHRVDARDKVKGVALVKEE
jgi:hypothetical protein